MTKTYYRKYKVTVLIISRIFLATTSVTADMDFSSFTTLQAHLDLLLATSYLCL